MRLLVTRPEPDATRTADALTALGHEPILSPMLEIVREPAPPLPAGCQAIAVTSANAVRALAAHPAAAQLHGLPLLAVGDRTALEARRAGFRGARSAGGGVAELRDLILAELDSADGPILYAAGDVRAGDLAADLGEAGFAVATVVLYRSVPSPRLSEAALAALRAGAVEGVLIFSAHSAKAFAGALAADGLLRHFDSVPAFAISEQAAAPLAGALKGPIRIAARPEQIALFALLEP